MINWLAKGVLVGKQSAWSFLVRSIKALLAGYDGPTYSQVNDFVNAHIYPLFNVFLMPGGKTGFVPFYKKGSPTGSLIEATFTRANTPEDNSESGRVVFDANGNLKKLAANEPAWSYPEGGQVNGCQFLSFQPSLKNFEANGDFVTNWAATTNFTKSVRSLGDVNGAFLQCNTSDNGVDYNEGLDSGSTTFTSNIGDTLSVNFIIKKTGANDDFAVYLIFGGAGEIACTFNTTTLVATPSYGVNFTNRNDSIEHLFGDYYLCHLEGEFSVAASSLSSKTLGFGRGVNAQDAADEGEFYGLTIVKAASKTIIPTIGTALTRQADRLPAINDLQGAGYISKNTDVGFLIQIRCKLSSSANSGRWYFQGNNGTSIRLYETSISPQTLGWWSAQTGYFFTEYPVNEAVKTFFHFSGGKIILYANGEKVYESADHGFNLVSTNAFDLMQKPVDILQFSFADTITEAEAIAATSWNDFTEMAQDLNYQID